MRRSILALSVMLLFSMISAPSLVAQTAPQTAPLLVDRPDWLIGVGVGATMSGSIGGLFAQDEFVSRWAVFGFSARVVAEYAPIPSVLWIESGVEIAQSGHGYRFLGGTTNASFTERVMFLSVPLIAKTSFHTGFGDVTVGGGAAFVAAVSTGGEIANHATRVTSQLAGDYYDGYLLPFNAALVATAAYEYPTPIGRFGIELIIDIHVLSDFDWGIPTGDNRLITGRVQALYRLGFR